MKIPIVAADEGAENDDTIDQMQDMEIMRKTPDSVISSTTVSSTTVLAERGNAETTSATVRDSSEESVVTTVPASSTIGSTTLPTDIINSDNETETSYFQ